MHRILTAALFAGCLLVPAFGRATERPTGEILFYGEERAGRGQLYMLRLEDGEIRPVGRSGSRPDHYPQWSPDGEHILFESYRAGGWHPWQMKADGSEPRRLTNFPGGNPRYYEFDASYSPDGSSVVLVHRFDLYTVEVDEKEPKRLGEETPEISEFAPAWSPDGRQIAYSGYRPEDESVHLYLLDLDSGKRRPLTSGSGQDLAPVWSPDGAHLLFYSDRGGGFEIFEVPSGGGTPRQVLDPEAARKAGFVAASLIDPWDNDNGAVWQYRASYSPDGRWIVFSREIDGDRELFLAPRSGTEIRRLTRRKGHDGMPVWRPRPEK